MLNAIRSEWLRLRRRGMLVGAGAIVALTVAVTVLTIQLAGSDGGAQGPRGGPPGPGSMSLAQLGANDGLARALGQASTLVGAVALVLFAISAANEFSLGTLRNLLVRQPRRLIVYGGKVLADTAWVSVALIFGCVLAAGLGLMVGGGKGIDTSAWTSSAGLASLGSHVINLVLASIGWGLLGALLGIAFRSPAPAVGVGLAYALPVEAVVSAVWSSGAKWLPGQLLGTLASGGSSSVTYLTACAALAAYAVAALAISAALLTYRDVTA